MQNKHHEPIKRAKIFIPISHEHQKILMFCFNIKIGLKRNVSIERIKKYIIWFYNTTLITHFNAEEDILLPLLFDKDLYQKSVTDEHKKLKSMVEQKELNYQNIQNFCEILEKHIRFEERELLNYLQDVMLINGKNNEKLANTKLVISERFNLTCEKYNDEFWIS